MHLISSIAHDNNMVNQWMPKTAHGRADPLLKPQQNEVHDESAAIGMHSKKKPLEDFLVE